MTGNIENHGNADDLAWMMVQIKSKDEEILKNGKKINNLYQEQAQLNGRLDNLVLEEQVLKEQTARIWDRLNQIEAQAQHIDHTERKKEAQKETLNKVYKTIMVMILFGFIATGIVIGAYYKFRFFSAEKTSLGSSHGN